MAAFKLGKKKAGLMNEMKKKLCSCDYRTGGHSQKQLTVATTTRTITSVQRQFL
jgi:hypothetical protein